VTGVDCTVVDTDHIVRPAQRIPLKDDDRYLPHFSASGVADRARSSQQFARSNDHPPAFAVTRGVWVRVGRERTSRFGQKGKSRLVPKNHLPLTTSSEGAVSGEWYRNYVFTHRLTLIALFEKVLAARLRVCCAR
jgi:hypothetical protein